jgi:alpha,alpha-trehalose-phosphate synthase [UDP-forming]
MMSNRAPIRIVSVGGQERIEPVVGGVGPTFVRLLERSGGLWIAWSGGRKTPTPQLMVPEGSRFKIFFVRLNEQDISDYYYGMCNRELWPLMHFMISNCHFTTQYWSRYEAVNRNFAGIAAKEAKPGDLLWVQDFHLALTPRFVRERRRELPIGIFWHVPFPPEQLLRILPWRNAFLEGLLGADLIGFHTQSYVMHFLNCCERILRLEVDRERGEVQAGTRKVRVGAFPLGIPTDYFSDLATRPRVVARARRIRQAMRTPVVILGVDRLDHIKGVLERLLGFERFLESNPAWHKRVTLVLIAVPSRTKTADYATLKRHLDELVGRVVGRFSSEGWVPVRYFYDRFGAEELVSYYRCADIGLLTPLRDGMNVVAKEFVASRAENDGVLILSEFAGAADELTEALLVNPYDADQIADCLKRAVEMSAAEKAARMSALRAKIHENNLEYWSGKFLSALASAGALADRVAKTDQI